MKKFYSHLIEYQSVYLELEEFDLSDSQRMHLGNLVDSTLHHTILDKVLSELSDADKRIFLKNLEINDHQKIWKHLNEKVIKIEEKIREASEELKIKLHQDLKEAKRIK